MIVDAHIYSLPARLRDPNADLPASECVIQTAIHKHPEGAYALSLSSLEAIEISMERCAIDKSVVVAFPWNDSELCRENNDHVLEAAATNDALLPICSIKPNSDVWQDEVERSIKGGAVGIKVNPTWQNFALDGPEMDDLLTLVDEQGVFLMTHVDQPIKKSNASPAHLFQLASRHPSARIMAAHMGGMAGFSALHEPNAVVLSNVWYDTALSSTLQLVRYYADAGLASRVFFGSDYPFNHSHSQMQVLEDLRLLNLDKRVEAGILGDNILSFLRESKTGSAAK